MHAYLYRQIRLYFRLQLSSASLLAKYIHLVTLAVGTQSAELVIIHLTVSWHRFSRDKHTDRGRDRRTIAKREGEGSLASISGGKHTRKTVTTPAATVAVVADVSTAVAIATISLDITAVAPASLTILFRASDKMIAITADIVYYSFLSLFLSLVYEYIQGVPKVIIYFGEIIIIFTNLPIYTVRLYSLCICILYVQSF